MPGGLFYLQGDIVAILDSSKNVVVSYVYDAWGRPISCLGTMANTLGKINPFRYRGYVYDEETELYYLRSRLYSPEVCRFLSADPRMLLMTLYGINQYAYCRNAPIFLVDADGDVWRWAYVFASTIWTAGVSGLGALLGGASAREVFAATVKGAISGFLEGLVISVPFLEFNPALETAAKIVMGGLANVVGSYVEHLILTGELTFPSLDDVFSDFLAGAIATSVNILTFDQLEKVIKTSLKESLAYADTLRDQYGIFQDYSFMDAYDEMFNKFVKLATEYGIISTAAEYLLDSQEEGESTGARASGRIHQMGGMSSFAVVCME